MKKNLFMTNEKHYITPLAPILSKIADNEMMRNVALVACAFSLHPSCPCHPRT